jgi:hypothetical protein
MLERAAALLAIALLTACSAPPGSASESVASSQSPLLTFEFTNLSVTPTDTTMTIAYAEPGALLAVTLGSQTVTASAITNSYTQNQSVTFSGLTPCTSYSWSIPAFSGAVTGQTNTLYTGSTACPATENIYADTLWWFEAAEHQEQQNIGCGNWSYPNWPVGAGWTGARIGGPGAEYSGGGTGLEFGYIHSSNSSSWCAESTVQVWRGELGYTISDEQWARGVTQAVFNARQTTASTSGADFCTGTARALSIETWEQNTQGPAWVGILPSAETDWGLLIDPNLWAHPANGEGGYVNILYGPLSSPRLVAGFAADNDGFADLSDGETQSWAADNNACQSTLSEAHVILTYAPMPPETPICTESLNCTTATVTCASSLETFQLWEGSGGNYIAGFDGTGGATPTLTDPNSAYGDTYSACTINAAGASTCAPVLLTNYVPCPTPPPPPPPSPSSMVVGSSPFWSGTSASVVLTMSAPVTSETVLLLTASDPSGHGQATGLSAPFDVIVPAGQSSVTFSITASASPLPFVVLTAGGSFSILVRIATGPFVMAQGSNQTLSFIFASPAPSGSVITLVDPAPTIFASPASVTVPAGSRALSVPLTVGSAYGTDTIVATYEGSTASVTLRNLQPLPPGIKPPPIRCVGLCQ